MLCECAHLQFSILFQHVRHLKGYWATLRPSIQCVKSHIGL